MSWELHIDSALYIKALWFLYMASCHPMGPERLQRENDVNLISATSLPVSGSLPNHLSLSEKDVGKGVCFRCLLLRTVVTSCASLTLIDHAKCVKLARHPPDHYNALAGIRKLIKALLFLCYFLLHWIHLVFNIIAGNQWRIIVVMRIIPEKALCCWELLVPELQQGLSQSGWNTLPCELLSMYI